jgi:CheY-like chemotaxis protein
MQMKLLIVDDNQQMRRLLKRLVGDLADEIGECADGVDALAAFTELRPDWVLMDIAMPLVDGISASRQILAAFPEAKVVIVTDHNDEQLRQAAAEVGACAYVLKEDLRGLRQMLCGRCI